MNNLPKVLMIDDEPDILQVVGMLLAGQGFEIEKASSGAEALKMMAEKAYDLVVCDYLMPKMDGIQLLKTVRGRGDLTSFVFFSGNADDTHEVKMTGLGAYQLVPKTQLMQLASVLHQTIKKDAQLREIKMDKTQESKDFLKLLHSA